MSYRQGLSFKLDPFANYYLLQKVPLPTQFLQNENYSNQARDLFKALGSLHKA